MKIVNAKKENDVDINKVNDSQHHKKIHGMSFNTWNLTLFVAV